MKLGIITGTTRKGNAGTAIGQWVHEALQGRTDVELVELSVADFDLNFLTEETIPGMANGVYEDEKTTAWAAAIKELDGFLFITPEYNAAPPAAMKNAVDLLFAEWSEKPVGFVGYGFHKGVRAVNQWRDIVRNLKMVDAETAVEIDLGAEMADGSFAPAEGQVEVLNKVVDEVLAAAK